jgi:MFS family permease
VPVGVVALVVGWRRLPDVPGHPVRRPAALGAVLVTGGVGALTFGLVQGNTWGWGSPGTVAALAASVVLLALFAVHCLRADNPMVSPALFRVRAFSGASLAMTMFATAFGAMLLSIVLWEQDVWGWSALKAGLAIAPGPVMVPLCSFLVAGRLIRRFGPAAVVSLGLVAFAAGLAWWARATTLQPDYSSVLGGMLLTGAGVGLTLPTLMASAAGSLPPPSFATGSAVVNMIRQIGLAVGVAVLVVVLGTPGTPAAALAAFHRGWEVAAAIALAGLVPTLLFLRSRPAAATAPASPAAEPAGS